MRLKYSSDWPGRPTRRLSQGFAMIYEPATIRLMKQRTISWRVAAPGWPRACRRAAPGAAGWSRRRVDWWARFGYSSSRRYRTLAPKQKNTDTSAIYMLNRPAGAPAWDRRLWILVCDAVIMKPWTP